MPPLIENSKKTERKRVAICGGGLVSRNFQLQSEILIIKSELNNFRLAAWLRAILPSVILMLIYTNLDLILEK